MKTHFLGATLLITGICVGAGMLALPVMTGVAGAIPAIVISAACWIYMLATGLLFLQATLWLEEGANVLSMSKRLIGRTGELIGGLSYIFLYYCLLVSYLAGGAGLMQDIFLLEPKMSLTLITSVFGIVIFLGVATSDRINVILMGGLLLTFAAMLIIGAKNLEQIKLFATRNWYLSLLATPTLFGAYGYHNIIPTLSTYLNRRQKELKLALIIGTAIPFVLYSLWQLLIIGIIPNEELRILSEKGEMVVRGLTNPWLSHLTAFFSFFAITTSIIGVSLAMVDFFGDGLSIQNRTGTCRFLFTALVFIPPALFAATYPHIFYKALGVAGGFGEAILNGLIPIAMVYFGRYRLGFIPTGIIPTSKSFLAILTLLTLIVMGIEARIILG